MFFLRYRRRLKWSLGTALPRWSLELKNVGDTFTRFTPCLLPGSQYGTRAFASDFKVRERKRYKKKGDKKETGKRKEKPYLFLQRLRLAVNKQTRWGVYSIGLVKKQPAIFHFLWERYLVGFPQQRPGRWLPSWDAGHHATTATCPCWCIHPKTDVKLAEGRDGACTMPSLFVR
jgi:hypothetical protein